MKKNIRFHGKNPQFTYFMVKKRRGFVRSKDISKGFDFKLNLNDFCTEQHCSAVNYTVNY